MVTGEWKPVEHKLIRNRGMRYVQLEIDKDTKAIVDVSPTLYGLLSFPTIHPWQKFDIYTITKISKEFHDESFLVNVNDIEKSKKLAKKTRLLPAIAIILFSVSGLSSILNLNFMKNMPVIFLFMIFLITFFSLRFMIFGWLVKRNFGVLNNNNFNHKKQAISLKIKGRKAITWLNLCWQLLGILLLLLSIIFPLFILLAALSLNLASLLNGAMPIGAKVYIKLNDNI